MWRIIWFCANVALIIFCIVGGVNCGKSCTSDKYHNWSREQIDNMSYQVKVYWDYEGNPENVSSIYVRKDLNWSIMGECGSDLYESVNPSEFDVNQYLQRFNPPAGKKFVGLWTSLYGGTQMVNSAGYSMMTVTANVTLYAVWEEPTHQVTIYWDFENKPNKKSTLIINELLDWTLEGNYVMGNEYSFDVGKYLSENVKIEGKVFKGLWTAMDNGTQVVNDKGYSLMKVDKDVTLYAVWE